MTSKDELYVYLDSLERRYETACTEIQLTRWNMLSKEGPYDLNSSRAKLAAIFLDSTAHKIIVEWRNRSGTLADKLLARRLELWYRAFIGGMIEFDPEIIKFQNTLRQQISNIKYNYGGVSISASEFSSKLRNEKNSKRRKKLWETGIKHHQILVPELLNIITLRNIKAQAVGFANYYSLTLYLQAIDEKWLLKTLNSTEELSCREYVKILTSTKKKLRQRELDPWDVEFISKDIPILPNKYFPADSMRNILHRFEKGIGFNIDILGINEYIKEDAYTTACLNIKIPTDIRMLLSPTSGMHSYKKVFHDYGHALRGKLANVDFPILKCYGCVLGSYNPSFDDGTAKTHALFLDDSLWLTKFTGVKSKEFKQYITRRNANAIVQLRRSLKPLYIEYELYRNPSASVDSLEREVFKRIFNSTIDEKIPQVFELVPQYISEPCTFQNHILSEMIAAQLHEALASKFGDEKISNPEISQWLTDNLYLTGETTEWYERIRNATGKSLEPGALLRKLGIEHMMLLTEDDKK
ncbi:MAG: hypothetical protein HY800_04695 [Ignavibacteriales bacterium]|nr:hypothetical protein [Ignavibacteriales bacterium]